jgi:hypothetical protein
MSLSHAERGRLGGRATASRHGAAHMARIGRTGFASFARLYAGGSRKLAVQYLREMGRLDNQRGARQGELFRRYRWLETGKPTFAEWLTARRAGGGE